MSISRLHLHQTSAQVGLSDMADNWQTAFTPKLNAWWRSEQNGSQLADRTFKWISFFVLYLKQILFSWHIIVYNVTGPRGGGTLGPTDSKVYGRQKRGVKILCVAAELKNRGQKSICGHKKGGQYSMSHWKIGVKILCVVLKRGSIFYESLKNRAQKCSSGNENSSEKNRGRNSM